MAQDNNQQVFFIDDDLIERLLRGDAAPVPPKPQRPAASGTLATAVELASSGKVGEAVHELEGALERGENAVEVHSGLGHLHFEQQQWSDAERHYAEVIAREPQQSIAHYNLALSLERQSRFEEAAKEFEATLALEPKRWQAQAGRAACLLKLNQPEAALPCWEAALKDLPASKKGQRENNLRFGKAVALHQLGRLQEAADLYTKLLPANPKPSDLLANLLALALARKEETQARDLADGLLKIDENSRVALEGLAAVALSRGDYSAAVQHCSQLVKVAADSYEGWFNLGVAYQKTGRLEQAATAYREALRLRPQAAEPNANLGAALQERGDSAGARESYQRALDAAPDLPGVLWNLAIAADRDGNAAEAEKLLEKLTVLEPDWQDAAFRLGYLKLQRSDYTGALACFESCLKKRKDWVEALFNRGLASWRLQDLDAAAESFRQVISIQPKHADALRSLAAIAIERKNPGDAGECIRKLAAAGAPAPELSYNLGLLHQAAGDFKSAAECYQVTLQHKPEFSGALINLGHALKATGQEDEARQAWSKAVAADPELASRYFQ